jgi:glutathione-regulated potassium-efflux system ancillary protein KefC
MDYIWIAVAFSCGFLIKQINMPPLIGYLLAGFGLHALGVKPGESIQSLADIGIILLLFTIGLKLKLKSLFKTEIWASAVSHMSAIVLLTLINSLLLGFMGVLHFSGLDWQAAAMIGFAVSFSSTVAAVKVLEDKGELRAQHGQITIGILVIQDIVAVVFITLATDTSATWWAFCLFLLPLLKPLLFKILRSSGHGEMLPLAGFFFAFSGAELFEFAGLKAHLGALAIGALLSGHEKAVELAKSLLNFKDLFLIGFFLSIGFTALPTVDMIGVALLMAFALPLKAGLFFVLLTQFKLRSRTAFLSALSLANYSEFGLILCAVGVSQGYIPKEWLVILALAVAISFIFSSAINLKAHDYYQNWADKLKKFQPIKPLDASAYILPKEVTILVVGMGRVGRGAYDTLQNELQKEVCGIEVDKEQVEKHAKRKRKVILADVEDPDFWAQVDLSHVQLVMFALPNHLDVLQALKQLKLVGYKGNTAGVVRYRDEERELIAAGMDVVFNYYANVGSGFAEETIFLFDTPKG